jgi:hypothetical protein
VNDSIEIAHTIKKPTVVCLCGSTRFYDAFQRANYEETMKGNIVLSVGFCAHAKDEMERVHSQDVGITPQQKAELDELHKRKIDLADEILVLNVGGYIGESTASEIHYARLLGKGIRYLESTPETRGGSFVDLELSEATDPFGWTESGTDIPPDDEDNGSVYCLFESPDLVTDVNPRGYGVGWYNSASDLWITVEGRRVDARWFQVIRPNEAPPPDFPEDDDEPDDFDTFLGDDPELIGER